MNDLPSIEVNEYTGLHLIQLGNEGIECEWTPTVVGPCDAELPGCAHVAALRTIETKES